jgi:integrase
MPVLTDITVRKATKTVWDSSVPGFCLRVTPNGAKTFYLIQGKQRERTKLGRVGVVTLAQAREKAKAIIAAKTLGISYEKVTVQKGVDQYLDLKEEKNRPGTFKETDRLLRKHLLPGLGHRALESISPKDIQSMMDEVKAPSTARHLYVAANGFFRWAVKMRSIPYSPCEPLEAPQKGESRERLLTDREVGKIIVRLFSGSQTTFAGIVRVLLYTGQRRNQVVQLVPRMLGADELSMPLSIRKVRGPARITFPGSVMKNGKEHVIPIGDELYQWLLKRSHHKMGLIFSASNGNQFTAWSKSLKAFQEDCGVDDWTLHDLRRYFSSTMAALGVGQAVTEHLLAHTSGQVSGVAAIYNRHDYWLAKVTAMTLYEQHLARVALAASGAHAIDGR